MGGFFVGDDMSFYLLLIGAMFGFMAGYFMGFCKADNMHHKVRNKNEIQT